MFGLAVRLAIGITCTGLLLTEAIGQGLPTYILMFAMLMAAVWKWAYRLVRFIGGTSSVIARKSEDGLEDSGISDHIEERIRQAALQQLRTADNEPIQSRPIVQPSATPVAFGKRR
jgi:hypothetical protein